MAEKTTIKKTETASLIAVSADKILHSLIQSFLIIRVMNQELVCGEPLFHSAKSPSANNYHKYVETSHNPHIHE
jgi:hypothetical protein